MVVGIHTVPNVMGFSSFKDALTILIRLSLSCSVPLFLAISGWFLAPKPLNNTQEVLAFYKKRFSRVYIPLIVFGLGWYFLSLWHEPTPLHALKSLLLLFTGGFSVYYFVALIMQCYALTPLFSRYYKRERGGVIACCIMSAIAIVITSYFIQIEKKSFPLLLYLGPFYLFGFYYVLGIWLRKHENKSYFKIGLILAILGYLVEIAEQCYYMNEYNQHGFDLQAGMFIYCLGIILIFVSRKLSEIFRKNKFTNAIAWIGEVSFGVYLMHVYLIKIVISFMGDKDPWILSWGLSLLLTMLIIWCVKKLLPQRFTFKYLGF